ncbi:MAG TPA: hypothetical protein VHV75_14265 [Solirubrobacteraceae bacterium]|jgi:hypothetical protein|nr:hypothetical protein [Solirubrobacteraceae bacterium]
MSVYAVNKLCYRIVQEPELREQLRTQPAEAVAAAQPPLSDEETRAFLAGDVGALSKMGVNHFLLHQVARWNLIDMDLPEYARRIRAAYR